MKSRYRLIIEDEAHLSRVFSRRLSSRGVVLAALGLLLCAVVLAVVIIIFTPLKHLLPGYLPPQERQATMEDVLKVDSLQRLYEINESYLQNIITLLDTDRPGGDSVKWAAMSVKTSGDSLLTASRREKEFRQMIDEREKFNLSILAPLASDGMLFSEPGPGYTFARGSESERVATIILPRGENVHTLLDGVVLDTHFSAGEGNVILIQHANGFISRWSRLGMPLVEEGRELSAGEAIARTSSGNGLNPTVTLELWRNGTRLIPFNILRGRHAPSTGSSPEEDRTPGN